MCTELRNTLNTLFFIKILCSNLERDFIIIKVEYQILNLFYLHKKCLCHYQCKKQQHKK